MPINDATLQRLADNLDRLPRRRKSYSKKQAIAFLADKIFTLLSAGYSIDSIFWTLERELRITKEQLIETLLSALKKDYPDDDPERVLAEIIAEGRPVVETTAMPRGISQQAPATGALPEPVNAKPQQEAISEDISTERQPI